jgi:hypothetical protein
VIHVPLSRLLIAFTTEFDNEFEHRMPHRTARGPAAHSGRGPWLISEPFWANFLQYVQGPAPLSALPAHLVNVPGLVRWGYIRVSDDQTVTMTAAGVRAQALFAPLAAEIEERGIRRYGDRLSALRGALTARLAERPAELPAHLPMDAPNRPDRVSWPAPPGDAGSGLSVLLARTLLLFTADVAATTARVPMGLGANTLRVLTAEGVRTRDLPVLTGTAREAVAVSLAALQRAGAATVESAVARLTPLGVRAQKHFARVTAEVSSMWAAHDLAAAAEAMLADHGGLVAGLTPYPEGWRANPPYVSLTKALLKDPARCLAQYPMVSHRGGYPDGS